MTANRTKATERREKLREEFWQNEDAWTGDNEKGWFRAPRTIPLLMALMGSKELSGNLDPTKVYLELLARHIDGGVIEMVSDADHAYAAGYDGTRGVRTWQERMRLLEELGFIKTRKIGNQLFKYVVLIHPTTAIQQLRNQKRIPDHWWDTYRARQIETKEAAFEDRNRPKVVSIANQRPRDRKPRRRSRVS